MNNNSGKQLLLSKIYSELIKTDPSSGKSMLDSLADIICDLFDDSDKAKVYYFSMPIWDYLRNCWKKPTVVRINMDNENEEANERYNNKKTKDNWIRIEDKKKNKNEEEFNKTTYKSFFNNASKSFSFIEFFTQQVKIICPIFTIDFSEGGSIAFNNDRLSCPRNIGEENYREDFLMQTKSLLTEGNLDEKQKEELDAFRIFLSKYKEAFADLKYIYLISSRLYRQEDNYIGSGGVILVCKDSISLDVLQQVSVLTNLCYRELGGKNWAERCKKESIKSAIAAIMSRNMSHNLGSHYLYYTKSQLLALAESLEEKGPEIRGAAKVLGYMQARMDYLATIVASEKYPYGSVYFKGQMFDELTIDDFSKRHFKGRTKRYKRTTNYLLQNLILSENFTRGWILDDNDDEHLNEENTTIDTQNKCIHRWKFLGKKKESSKYEIHNKVTVPDCSSTSNGESIQNRIIRLQILIKESVMPELSVKDRVFTGLQENEGKETLVKLGISKICIALPGGIMSIHAFYNVMENLIRNSAKYRKEDFYDKDLVFTIAIDEFNGNKELPDRYRFVIYDNKSNANKLDYVLNNNGNDNKKTLLESMNEKLERIKILKENNELDKGDKGLKEMLFSTIWMRAYTYEKAKDLSDILLEIDSKSGKDKMNEINEHGFKYVAVDEYGNTSKDENANLGISFELPKYKTVENIGEICSEDELIRKCLNNFRDIACVKPGTIMTVSRKGNEPDYELKKVFTRLYAEDSTGKSEIDIFKSVLGSRFDELDKYKINIEKEEKGYKKETGILFITHLGLDNQQQKDHLRKMKKSFYSEAISGGNFTKTMQDILQSGMDNNGVIDKKTEYFALKVKESALTRITLIDERFYKDMMDHSTKPKDENPISRDFVLKCKNIRILTLNDLDNNQQIENNASLNDHELVKKVFVGNDFKDGKDHTHFLSIHLGMIEKIVKDEKWCELFKIDYKNKIDIGERAKDLLLNLKKLFNSDKKEIFVSIHSGRGNFSKELEESLKDYPFISVSALDAALSNCKFLLAQLFYNTVYIGKGIANEKF